FLTFSLSNLAMTRFWFRHRAEHPMWARHLPAHVLALVLCLVILGITIFEKFSDGGWVTLVVTAALVALCFMIRAHYQNVVRALRQLDVDLPSPPEVETAALESRSVPGEVFKSGPTLGLQEHHSARDPDRRKPVAILLVGAYSGLGRHALLSLLR